MAGRSNGAIVPSSGQPMVDNKGRITPPWQLFLNALVSQPSGVGAVVVTASPFAYLAAKSGSLLVSGGTVSAITLTRGATVVSTGQASGFVPVVNGDTVTITYSVAPTITFIPG